MTTLKFVFLTLAIAYSFTCIGRLIRNQRVSVFQIMLMAVGIAGFILLE